MPDSPQTRQTLLLRLRDPADAAAWSDFVSDYGPMLYRFVRSRGLQDADTADLVQDVLRSVGGAIGRFEHDGRDGGFRGWLFKITRNKLSTHFQQKVRRGPTANDTAQHELLKHAPSGEESELERSWELEYQRLLAAKAFAIVEAAVDVSTWQAFHRTTVDGASAEEVAKEIGMSRGAVYVAKSRVIARLREEIERLQAEEESP
ncbi:MAG: sigma-70 family RNA polymerase sigma factor [Planctomycetota bacterium]